MPEGAGEQILGGPEVVGHQPQRRTGLLGNGAMSQAPASVARQHAQGRVEQLVLAGAPARAASKSARTLAVRGLGAQAKKISRNELY